MANSKRPGRKRHFYDNTRMLVRGEVLHRVANRVLPQISNEDMQLVDVDDETEQVWAIFDDIIDQIRIAIRQEEPDDW